MGGVTIDPVFSLRCVDCDALGEPSRLWIRRTVDRADLEDAASTGPDASNASASAHGSAPATTSSSGQRLSRSRASRPFVSRHYVECMNCGAHLKGRADGRMEPVDDEEWRHFVDEGVAPGGPNLRPS